MSFNWSYVQGFNNISSISAFYDYFFSVLVNNPVYPIIIVFLYF